MELLLNGRSAADAQDVVARLWLGMLLQHPSLGINDVIEIAFPV